MYHLSLQDTNEHRVVYEILFRRYKKVTAVCRIPLRDAGTEFWRILKFPYQLLKIRGTTAPKSQGRLKRLLPDGSTGSLVVSKAIIPQP